MDKEKNEVAHSILDMCRQLVSVLHTASKSSEKLLGLSAAQLFVLQKMSDGEVRSLNELAALTYTHQTSVSVVVKKLVGKKLLSSRPAKDDARRLELRITAAGKKKLQGAPEPIQEKLLRGIKAMPANEAQELERLLLKMLSDFEQSQQPAQLFFAE